MGDNLHNTTNFFKRLAANPPELKKMTNFTFSPSNSTLLIKDEFTKAHKCRYRCIHPVDDYQFHADEWKELAHLFNQTVTSYNNLYYQIYRPPINLTPQQETSSTQQPSTTLRPSSTPQSILKQQPTSENEKKREKKGFGVHIVVIDSVSRSNFIRSLPHTMYLLKEEFEAISFDHLNKAGLNSMPNAFGFLFGRQMESVPKSPFNNETLLPDPGYDRPTICNKNLDNETSSLFLIFKNLGYRMMMAEDWARGALNWPGCLGFKVKPCDHYMRPFQIRLAELGAGKYEKSQCREAYLSLLDYLKQFVDVYKDEQEKFSITWMSYLTHDYLNQLHHADDTFYNFFKEVQPKMEDSFVFFMGDHGLRFGGHRYTATGIMEDNNPGLFIAIARSSHTWDDTDWDTEWKADEYPEAFHGSSLFTPLQNSPEIVQLYASLFLTVNLAIATVEKLNKDIAKYKYEDKCVILSLDDSKDRVLKLEELQMEKLDTDEEKGKMQLLAHSESAFRPSLAEANLLAS
uniref:Sulfatase N-terminal domain-containing protein n=1 Tax=Ditylenchus dipsaci TaxID=166011 RepID=A0A915EQX2_9BILA